MPSLVSSQPQPHPPLNPQPPLRILHVIGNLDCGGIETWLMQVLRRVSRQDMVMDFLVHSEEQGYYAEEAKALGSQILVCPYSRNPWTYAQNFKRVLGQHRQSHPPYDIIHSHIHWLSGQVLWLAQQLGIRHRIAHSHNDTRPAEAEQGIVRQLYRQAMGYLLQRYATQGIAVSRLAAEDLFGSTWEQDRRWHLLGCGVDFKPFTTVSPQARQLRTELGIPPDSFVVGHVGRLTPQKNHHFLIRLFRELLLQQENAYLLLIGEGELRAEIEAQVNALNLSDRVIFTGLRSDVVQLMQSAMDCFCFPSIYEGLGLVAIEAQAAGLPCLLSEKVPPEAVVIPDLVQFFSLAQSPEQWAQALVHYAQQPRPAVVHQLCSHPLNIDNNVTELKGIYRG